jgi:hypothetical protein
MMRKSMTIALIIAIPLAFVLYQCGSDKTVNSNRSDDLIANHLASHDFDDIPESYVDLAKTNFHIFYMHTSHGGQVLSGMYMLADDLSLYSYNDGDSTLSIQEYSDDLGYDSDTSWAPITREYLDQEGSEFNIVMWSWCGGMSSNTESGVNVYLNKVNELEQQYPNVTFIYMTGHLDGTGADGNLYARNNQVREYCAAHNKVLFDFADIESYDPAGNYYPDASDACEWCEDWCVSHDCPSCDCAHSHCFNCLQKGKAFWWLLARLAGWNGE